MWTPSLDSFIPSSDAVVSVVGAELPWLLTSPPERWSASSVLLVGNTLACDPRALLQTALAQRTPAVAALCLAKLGEQRNKLEFRVFTWRPLHPRRKLLLLGGWNASRFASWDQLFVDRFSSFGGVTLHVASNTNEPPALFKTNSSQLDGLGYRILSTLAEKYNFNFTLTTTSSDGMLLSCIAALKTLFTFSYYTNNDTTCFKKPEN